MRIKNYAERHETEGYQMFCRDKLLAVNYSYNIVSAFSFWRDKK
jgi:hypothetical protein